MLIPHVMCKGIPESVFDQIPAYEGLTHYLEHPWERANAVVAAFSLAGFIVAGIGTAGTVIATRLLSNPVLISATQIMAGTAQKITMVSGLIFLVSMFTLYQLRKQQQINQVAASKRKYFEEQAQRCNLTDPSQALLWLMTLNLRYNWTCTHRHDVRGIQRLRLLPYIQQPVKDLSFKVAKAYAKQGNLMALDVLPCATTPKQRQAWLQEVEEGFKPRIKAIQATLNVFTIPVVIVQLIDEYASPMPLFARVIQNWDANLEEIRLNAHQPDCPMTSIATIWAYNQLENQKPIEQQKLLAETQIIEAE